MMMYVRGKHICDSAIVVLVLDSFRLEHEASTRTG